MAELAADYRTTTGEQRQLAFEKDVSVRLNTRTSIKVRSEGDAAELELIDGEASFRLLRPFAVSAADGRMTASRAHFDVRRVGQRIAVTSLEGDVNVTQRSDTRLLGSGQQVTYDSTGFGDVSPVDVELVSAWQEGVLIFRLTPLSDVVDEINRYRPGKVIVFDPRLSRLAVSGRFRIDHMDDILLRLRQALGVKSRLLPGGIVLLT